MRILAKLMAAPLALVALAPTSAAVYSIADGTGGNQAWSGTLGQDFHVNSPLAITSIGVFDSGRDGITTDIKATIFTSAGARLLTPLSFNGTANADGSAYLFQSLATPLVLGTGDYQLATWNFNDTDQNYNSYGGNSAVSFDTENGELAALGTHYGNQGQGGAFATNVDDGVTRYGAGTFTVAGIPANMTMPTLTPAMTYVPGV